MDKEVTLTIKGLKGDKGEDGINGKDIDMSIFIDSISTIEKAIKDKKFDKFDTSNIEQLLKDISNKKIDNKDIILSIDKLAKSLQEKDNELDYTDKFDLLIKKVGEIGLFRAGYNSYDPIIRNIKGDNINPATSDKQDEIISAIQNVKIDTGDIDLNTDEIESKLDTVISNQLPDNHQVEVSNQITGFSTENKQDSQITLQQESGGFLWWLKTIVKLLKPLSIVTGGGSNRLSVDVNAVTGAVGTVTTVTTVTTVSNVANQTNIGNVSAFTLQQAMLRNAFANGIRNNLV